MATNYRIGQSVGSQLAVRALSTVIDQTLPYALEDVTRDLERARMEKEDLVVQVLKCPFARAAMVRYMPVRG